MVAALVTRGIEERMRQKSLVVPVIRVTGYTEYSRHMPPRAGQHRRLSTRLHHDEHGAVAVVLFCAGFVLLLHGPSSRCVYRQRDNIQLFYQDSFASVSLRIRIAYKLQLREIAVTSVSDSP
jgi:hypothetical protein